MITARSSVYECAAPPRAIELPRLDLLISNKTAQQQQSFHFGGTCPRDPWTDLRARRFPNPPSPTPTSPGQDTHDRLTRR
ncbi:hypothetical protein [Streptomyces sp. NPDC060027]|uniref:hypothetical protein n=1 Tax=Streptomyces sp. NPDC060027 TaxID=3347040 RepID=UPI00367F9046